MKFKTTREDYEKAVKEVLAGGPLDNCCLVAQTLKRVMPSASSSSGCTSVTVNGRIYNLPIEVQAAVLKFDMSFSHLRRPDMKQVADGFMEVEFDLPIEEEPREVPA